MEANTETTTTSTPVRTAVDAYRLSNAQRRMVLKFFAEMDAIRTHLDRSVDAKAAVKQAEGLLYGLCITEDDVPADVWQKLCTAAHFFDGPPAFHVLSVLMQASVVAKLPAETHLRLIQQMTDRLQTALLG